MTFESCGKWIKKCNPLTSSHYACASHFAHSVVHGKLIWLSVIGTVCSVETRMAHAVILITVNKDQLWQYLKLLSITGLWIWSQHRGTSGLPECGEQELPRRALWCQVLPHVHFIACCRSTVAPANATVTCGWGQTVLAVALTCQVNGLWCVVLSGTFPYAFGQSHTPVITLDFGFLLWCEQAFFNSLWRSKFFTCGQCRLPMWPVIIFNNSRID